MDISLIAKMKTSQEFLNSFKEGDEKKLYDGKSLLFFSASNNDPEARFTITNYLLDLRMDASVVNEENESLLHILLSRQKHVIDETTEMCKKVIEGGADINQLDSKNRLAIQWLISMVKYSDDMLKPLYDLWFSQPGLVFNVKNDWDKTPIEIAESMPFRKQFLERIEEYESNGKVDK